MKILTIVGVSVNTLPHLKNNSLPPPFPTPQILGNPPFLKFREPPPPPSLFHCKILKGPYNLKFYS